MTSDPRLESYLTSLEHVLRPFPVSDRAEIVTEIKSHVLSALERDSGARLDTVLSALGEPETVANRYLIERGLKPTKPPISPMIKWIVIGFLSTFAMLLIFVSIVVMKLTPLLHIDDLKNKVSLFGGLIEVDGKNGKVWISGSVEDGMEGAKYAFNGSETASKGESISLKFENGKFALVNARDSKMTWACKSRDSLPTPPSAIRNKDGVTLDLNALPGVKCEVSIPENTRFSIAGTNAKLSFDEPHYDVTANLTNGKVTFTPDIAHNYRYAVSLDNGKMDSFESSTKANAHSIAIHLLNGKISRGD